MSSVVGVGLREKRLLTLYVLSDEQLLFIAFEDRSAYLRGLLNGSSYGNV